MRSLIWELLGGGCRHANYSWPQGKAHKTIVVCLECGERLRYDWQKMSIVPWPKAEKVKQAEIAPVLEREIS